MINQIINLLGTTKCTTYCYTKSPMLFISEHLLRIFSPWPIWPLTEVTVLHHRDLTGEPLATNGVLYLARAQVSASGATQRTYEKSSSPTYGRTLPHSSPSYDFACLSVKIIYIIPRNIPYNAITSIHFNNTSSIPWKFICVRGYLYTSPEYFYADAHTSIIFRMPVDLHKKNHILRSEMSRLIKLTYDISNVISRLWLGNDRAKTLRLPRQFFLFYFVLTQILSTSVSANPKHFSDYGLHLFYPTAMWINLPVMIQNPSPSHEGYLATICWCIVLVTFQSLELPTTFVTYTQVHYEIYH